MSDWRIVKVDWTSYCGPEFVQDRGIKECGIYYLIDVARHVHICSLTPSLEAWPMHAYVEFVSDTFAERDEGESEREIMASEEACSYFDCAVAKLPNVKADNYVPDPESDETEEEYYMRTVEEVREYLAGNPVGF